MQVLRLGNICAKVQGSLAFINDSAQNDDFSLVREDVFFGPPCQIQHGAVGQEAEAGFG